MPMSRRCIDHHSSVVRTTCVALALVVSSASQAAEISCVSPSRDATIYGGTGFDNTADGAGPHVWTSVTNGGFTRRALLRFELSAVPAGSVVTAVELSLTQSRSLSSHNVTVHRLTAAWTEGPANPGNAGAGAAASAGDVTWLSRSFPGSPWGTPGGDFVAQASAITLADAGAGAIRVTWPSTPTLVDDVQRWVNTPAANHGWVLIGDETDGQKGKRFDSRDNGIAANRPCLRVVYDPAPTDIPLPAWALWLMAAGLLAAQRTPNGLGRRDNHH
jgi:hypothetical protein